MRWLRSVVAVFLVVMGLTRVATPVAPQARAAREGERADFVVAQDGSTDFRTIQEALDAVPPDNATNRIILIRNGTYREKLFITRSHVSLVGEDRDRTRIEYAELRRVWRESHPDDWGAAVINIGSEATDLIFANLTVRNDYGKLHGDHDHQFAIRSGGNSTRISLLHANVIADGGDTLGLWNTATGLSYQNSCYFEGWVDYVCPRGWSYVTNSRFFGHNEPSASIWHDGSQDRSQKFVIRQSRFDGVPGFPLGRNHRDGQFYLLDAEFSENMADRPIYSASPPESYKWGQRYYYWNCHRDGGDFRWFADNLAQADGSPDEGEITAAWTFGGRWDPERTLPPVLPFAAISAPRDGGRLVDVKGTTLRWIAGRNAVSHDVYFGTTNPPAFRANQQATSFDPGALEAGTTYYWRVDEVTPAGKIAGEVWRFSTMGSPRAAGQAVKPSLTWASVLGQTPDWYASPEAERIADNVRLYQRRTGGWPKNIDMAQPLSDQDRATATADKVQTDSTIDNGATLAQLRYLARVFEATRQERFRASILEGLDFLFDAQYANGGWPQFYPLRDDYSRHITFNDLAMIGTMMLLGDIAESRPPFGFVDAPRRTRAAGAVERGLHVVLATHIRVRGRPTGWCAQYDEVTLEPRGARTYEHPSIDSRETADIARYLMRIPNPGPAIVEAIDSAVAWLREARLTGLRVEKRADASAPLGYDVVVAEDPAAPPLWARFCEIGTNQPIFSGRDGVVKRRLSEIEYERRTGYGWLGTWPAEVLEKDYPAWKARR